VIELRKIIENSDYATQIEIDGGVKIENIPICVQAGADILVCGSSVYNDQSQPEENLANLRDAIRSKDL